MSKERDKGLDDLFKKKLEDPVDEPGYKEEDWAALEQMLKKHKKGRGIVYWLPVVSSIAALLLLFLGWWNFGPQGGDHASHGGQQAINHHKPNTGINGGSNRQHINPKQAAPNSTYYAGSPGVNKSSNTGKPTINLSAVGSRRATTGPNQNDSKDIVSNRAGEKLFAQNLMTAFSQEKIAALPVGMVNFQNKNSKTVAGGAQLSRNNIRTTFRPQYALSVLAAPDINGVGSFQQSQVGTNVGLLFSAGVSRKLTISTGVLYSNKPYLTPFENYHTQYQFSTDPVNVTADCRMLDIPINVGYQIFNKHQNKISIGTGLSSYIMLHQSFTFNYADTYNTGPSNFNVPNVDKYLFGVLNLNATYERQINSKVGISFQPYLKLPLSNIGYSQVKLQTTGVAVGLSWNLNSLSKP